MKWCRLQKMRQREIEEKKREEGRDRWFNQAWPMIRVKQTLRGKRLGREESSWDSRTSEGTTISENVISAVDIGENGTAGSPDVSTIDVNIVFVIPAEFHAPGGEVAELALRAVFEKPARAGTHMKPLYIKGHLDGKPMGRMMVDGRASVTTIENVFDICW
jgi:hypothetical protein